MDDFQVLFHIRIPKGWELKLLNSQERIEKVASECEKRITEEIDDILGIGRVCGNPVQFSNN